MHCLFVRTEIARCFTVFNLYTTLSNIQIFIIQNQIPKVKIAAEKKVIMLHIYAETKTVKNILQKGHNQGRRNGGALRGHFPPDL